MASIGFVRRLFHRQLTGLTVFLIRFRGLFRVLAFFIYDRELVQLRRGPIQLPAGFALELVLLYFPFQRSVFRGVVGGLFLDAGFAGAGPTGGFVGTMRTGRDVVQANGSQVDLDEG